MYSHEEHVDDLLDVAHDLIGLPSFPKRAVKCRIVSTLYYALFRELCGSNADALIGTELRKALMKLMFRNGVVKPDKSLPNSVKCRLKTSALLLRGF